MGASRFGDHDVTITVHGTDYRGDVANIGNPHFVCFVDDPETTRVTTHGPIIERNDRVPERRPTSSSCAVDGGTRSRCACGSGARARRCRAARARARPPRSRIVRGLVGDTVCVRVPGGELDVALGATVRLGGPVVHVFDVDVEVCVTQSRSHTNRQRRRLTATEVDFTRVRQRALLIGTTTDESLDELALLADTAGADPVHRELQQRRTPDPATYIGKGKAEELREVARGARHRRRDLRRRAHARAAAQPREVVRGRRRRPRRADPRHLRPARDEPGRRGAGRARAAALPLAAPARPRHRAQSAGCGHRYPGSR